MDICEEVFFSKLNPRLRSEAAIALLDIYPGEANSASALCTPYFLLPWWSTTRKTTYRRKGVFGHMDPDFIGIHHGKEKQGRDKYCRWSSQLRAHIFNSKHKVKRVNCKSCKSLNSQLPPPGATFLKKASLPKSHQIASTNWGPRIKMQNALVVVSFKSSHRSICSLTLITTLFTKG